MYTTSSRSPDFYTSTGDNSEVDLTSAPTRRNGKCHEKRIVNSIFMEASKFEADPEWKAYLVNAAHGTFPSRVSYKSSGELIYYGTKKNTNVMLPKAPDQIAGAFRKFLRENGIFLSDRDVRAINADLDLVSAEMDCKISTNTRSAEFYTSLMTYTREYVSHFGLKGEVRVSFESLIKLGYALKIIRPNNVDYEGNAISNVPCVLFSNGTFVFDQEALLDHIEKSKKKSQRTLRYDPKYVLHEMHSPSCKKKHTWETLSGLLDAVGPDRDIAIDILDI